MTLFEGMLLEKSGVEVEVFFTSGGAFNGFFYLKRQQRISDLLNDSREFIPFKITSGAMMLINKKSINRVMPIEGKDDNGARKSKAKKAVADSMSYDDAIALLGLQKPIRKVHVVERYNMLVRHLSLLPMEMHYLEAKIKEAHELIMGSLKLEGMS